MANTLKVSAFIVIVVIAIAGFASMIPQVDSPAPEAVNISSGMTGAELAAVGQEVFESPESGCTACHAVGREGLRGPDLANIGGAAAERVPGEPAEEYLWKSIVDPCDHVTPGYDCIMPPTLLQTLGEARVTALVAYMQSLGGEVTVSYAGEQAVGGAQAGGAQAGGAQAGGENNGTGQGLAGTTGEEILTNAGCTACHTIGELGVEQGVGPDLTTIGTSMSAEEIRQAILDPDAVVSEACPQAGSAETAACPPGIMPKDYGQRLSAAQMETLVAYLGGLK